MSSSPSTAQMIRERKMALAARIRDLLEQVVLQTAQGSVPGFLITKACKEKTYLDRATQTIQLDSIRDQRLVKLGKREHFSQLLRLLVYIYEGLVHDVVSTKRSLYYKDVALFKSQATIDRLLSQVELTLDCRPQELNIAASAKGLLRGPAQITLQDGKIIDLEKQTYSIAHVEEYASIDLSRVDVVLVVEKDAVFQTLCQLVDAAAAAHPSKRWLIMTAKGYADVSSRQALHFMEWTIASSQNPIIRAIPLLCLVDLDPHGIEILAIWKFGSIARAAQSAYLATTSLRWLGVHVEELADVQQHLLPLSPADNKKLDALLCRDWCTGAAQGRSWLQQVMWLKRMQVKAEIEVLAEKPAGILGTVTTWVQVGNWL